MYEDLMGAEGGGRGEAVSHLKLSDEDSLTSPWGFSLQKWKGLPRSSHFLREIPWG